MSLDAIRAALAHYSDGWQGEMAITAAEARAAPVEAAILAERVRVLTAERVEHDRLLRVDVLRKSAEVVRLEPTWDLSEDGAYERAAVALEALADRAEGGRT